MQGNAEGEGGGEDEDDEDEDDEGSRGCGEIERGCDVSRRPATLPCFVQKDMASYRSELIAIGVLNGIIAGRVLRDHHVTADPGGSSGVCLYEKYFGMPSAGAAAPP